MNLFRKFLLSALLLISSAAHAADIKIMNMDVMTATDSDVLVGQEDGETTWNKVYLSGLKTYVLTGNAATATALAANGANCSAGNAPLGVSAAGAVESCFDVWTESENTAAAYLSTAAIDTSAELRSIVTDETGTGALVFGTSPSFTTPNIGSATGSISGNAGTATALAANGTNCSAGNYPLGVDASGNVESCTAASGSGTVTTVSVASANGFAGSVANATSTPAITISTSITGITKGNGTALSAATAGTDYYAPGSTDVAVADGGTGSSTKGGALTNLGVKQEYCVAMSDQSTNLTTGNSKAYLYLPAAATVNAVRAFVNTAPVGSTIIVDINEAGTTLMSSTKLSIDASEKTSGTAASAAALTDTSIAANAEITFDIDQIGSSTAGKGLVACVDVTF